MQTVFAFAPSSGSPKITVAVRNTDSSLSSQEDWGKLPVFVPETAFLRSALSLAFRDAQNLGLSLTVISSFSSYI